MLIIMLIIEYGPIKKLWGVKIRNYIHIKGVIDATVFNKSP